MVRRYQRPAIPGRENLYRKLQQLAGVDDPLVHLGEVVRLVGRAELPTVRRHELIVGVAEDQLGRPVDAHEREGIRVLDVDHRREVVEDVGQEAFVVAQRFFGFPPVRHVLVGPQDADDSAVTIQERDLAHADPALAAVGPIRLSSKPSFGRPDRMTAVSSTAYVSARPFQGRSWSVLPMISAGSDNPASRANAALQPRKTELRVLPEHSLRDGVEHQPEHLLRSEELCLRAAPVDDVVEGRDVAVAEPGDSYLEVASEADRIAAIGHVVVLDRIPQQGLAGLDDPHIRVELAVFEPAGEQIENPMVDELLVGTPLIRLAASFEYTIRKSTMRPDSSRIERLMSTPSESPSSDSGKLSSATARRDSASTRRRSDSASRNDISARRSRNRAGFSASRSSPAGGLAPDSPGVGLRWRALIRRLRLLVPAAR